MKRVTILLISLLLFIGVAYAAKTITVNTPGHVHINGGNRAGLLITPNTIEFGNVTVGDPANVTITAKNTGNCVENVTLIVSAVPANVTAPVVYSPFPLSPGGTITVLAIYTADQTITMPPGDYSFGINWTATCI